jgi:proteic killer suppression protein
MVIVIENDYLEKLFTGKELKGKPKYSDQVIKKFIKAVIQMENAVNLNELKTFRGLNFEALSGDLKGKYSVRVDIKYRLILRVEKGRVVIDNMDIIIVEELTNHYK